MLRLEQALVQLQELAQMQVQRLVQVPELEPPLVQVQGRESARQQELAAAPEPRQARELRVSRQLELQQHRLPTAAQELLPYLPVLPTKAPCWGAPAW